MLMEACGGGSGEDECTPGVEGCACTPQGQCLGGLQCLSNFCVSGPGPGSAETGGDPPTTGDASGEADTGGEPDCPTGQQRCGDDCYDLSGDPQHCGSCDKACEASGVCLDGDCATIADCTQEPCPGLTYCDEATKKCLPGCMFNPQCATGEHCDTGTHTCVCNDGFNSCGGVCIIGDDPQACGPNCVQCPGVEHGDAICLDGECDVACEPGFTACGGTCHDNEVEPICSLDLDTCKPCIGQLPNATENSCSFGACQYDCINEFLQECGQQGCTVKENGSCEQHEDCCNERAQGCMVNANPNFPDYCELFPPCTGGCPDGNICGKTGHCTIPCADDNDCPYGGFKNTFCFEEYGYCLVKPQCPNGWVQVEVEAMGVILDACKRQ